MKHSFPVLLALAITLPAASAQVVINEVMFDPEDNTKPTEFIELHNAGAAAVQDGTRPPDACAPGAGSASAADCGVAGSSGRSSRKGSASVAAPASGTIGPRSRSAALGRSGTRCISVFSTPFFKV